MCALVEQGGNPHMLEQIEIEKRADKTGFVKEVKVEHTHANTVDAPPLVCTRRQTSG